MNTTIFSEILIDDFKRSDEATIFKENFDKTVILSVAELDSIQPHVTVNDSIFNILKRLKKNSFNDEIKALFDKTGRSLKDSYLGKYFNQITDNIK